MHFNLFVNFKTKEIGIEFIQYYFQFI